MENTFNSFSLKKAQSTRDTETKTKQQTRSSEWAKTYFRLINNTMTMK